jgi:hypothetical protein
LNIGCLTALPCKRRRRSHITYIRIEAPSARYPDALRNDWGELVQVHDDRAIFQGRIDELAVIDIHSL